MYAINSEKMEKVKKPVTVMDAVMVTVMLKVMLALMLAVVCSNILHRQSF